MLVLDVGVAFDEGLNRFILSLLGVINLEMLVIS